MTKFTINTRTEAWKADVNLLIQRLFRISRHPLKQEQKGNCPLMKNLSLKLSICTKKLLFCRVYALTYKFTRAEDWTRVLKTFIRQLTFLVKCWVTFDVGVFLTRKGIRPTGNHLFRSSTAFLTKAAPTLHRRNLKTDVSLWKHIKCFPSTVPQRNLKTEVSLWKHIKCFPSTLRWRNLKTQQSPVILDLCMGKLGQGNHVIIVTSPFSKSYVFSQNVFHPHENAKSAICWRAFLKSSISETD